ncbi:hypothetical protein OEZ86_008443 [Tetradesmus obliquus]|nr:hypothetical protein OEZ86_008443 [Tetradesmus obliquus]
MQLYWAALPSIANTTQLLLLLLLTAGCKPGFGGPSCDICKPGFWSPGGAANTATACRACPDGSITLGEGSTIKADCLSTAIDTNTTIPVNLTTIAEFTLEGGTCSKGLQDALVAKYVEGKRDAAATDGLLMNATSAVLNCTQVAGSSSIRIFTQSITISATAAPDAGNNTASPAADVGTVDARIASVSAAAGSSSATVSPQLFGWPWWWPLVFAKSKTRPSGGLSAAAQAAARAREAAAVANLGRANITSNGTSANVSAAGVAQFQMGQANGSAVIVSSSTSCLDAPPSSLWQLPTGVSLAGPSWQLACGSTLKGKSCTASACDKGTGDLTATCAQDGKWANGTGSCSPLTCEKAAAPAFVADGAFCGGTAMPSASGGWATNGAPLDGAAWGSVCGQAYQGDTCSAAACGGSFTGMLSAVCQADGQWGQLGGTCSAGTCSSSTISVPTSGGGTFSAAAWAAACGFTPRGSGCSASACSAGTGSISATCDASGSWVNVQGACTVAVSGE